ncbi:hypothetical protein [Methylorubrum extorquens]|uniref:Uncharacterized protein n=1 Tax=Methylorubrum extorquens TaxID=408 RepID=A0AAX3WI67_METEX|nr:hypothetical protein [Methylorubrum extorquens]KQQ07688.1 hypothetical protein ASF59_23265 [Methylobacterium sp. Leaf121]WHQ70551.1 hypothetical protein KEC54_02705 [Methylorubrum extorquens]
MPDSTLTSVAFPSLKTAQVVRDRLARAGFARNSIDIERHGEEFEVSITTREENRARAKRILSGSPLGNDLRLAGTQALNTFHANRALALGLAALAGVALYSLMNRR